MARPTLYDPSYCDRVVELGKEGKSKAQMAADIGVHRETLDEWAKVHPEFSDSITRARNYSQAWWEAEVQRGIWSREFNAAAWAKSMSARFPDDYSDRSKLELTGKDGGPVQIDDNQAATKMAAILEAAKARKDSSELA